jgi:hypothetical protein
MTRFLSSGAPETILPTTVFVVLQPDSAKNKSDKKKELNKIKYCFFMQCLYSKLEYNIKKLEVSLPFLPGFMDLGHACGRWPVITPGG